MNNTLERVTAEISRESEYFSVKELQIMTGRSSGYFGDVVIKELIDNAIDAAEKAGVSPEIEFSKTEKEDGYLISVKDNGTGLKAEIIEKILDFSKRVSDKSIYKSPSRGAQGNAFKTIIGIPYALGIEDPVIIESFGKKYIIKAGTDPLGNINIDKNIEPSDIETGTKITVSIPKSFTNYDKWPYFFSVFNPHVTFTFIKNGKKIENSENDGEEIKQADKQETETKIFTKKYSFPDEYKKFTPTDFTSPFWYDVESFEKLIYSYILCGNGKSNITVRDFIREFRGLTSTGKAKSITDKLPGIFRLKDFMDKKEQIETLLSLIKQEIKPPKPGIFGYIGEEYFTGWVESNICKIKCYRYKREESKGGIPYIIEAFIAETENNCNGIFYGINFSPSYSDPLESSEGIKKEGLFTAYSFKGFLDNCYCNPSSDNIYNKNNIVAIIHIISPCLIVLDRGKSKIEIGSEMSESISKALWDVCKCFYEEGKKREKDGKDTLKQQEKEEKEERRRKKSLEWNVKEAVFHVLKEAYIDGTSNENLPISARQLYYIVRSLIQEYTNKKLEYNYFSQDLLTEYQRKFEELPQLYYKPREYLYEPHTRNEIKLGTREVKSYSFPELLYNKILYVEKEGLFDVLKAGKIPEKYDLAIISGEGYSTTAVRNLLLKANKHTDYKLFVLHDADPAGYDIARTLKEETERMPGYSIDIIDMGLKLEEAIEIGLEAEEFTRKDALPKGLELNELEREYFEGISETYKYDIKKGEHKTTSWICKRIEISVLKPENLLKYVEKKLQDFGATSKIIPEDKIKKNIIYKFEANIENLIEARIRRLFDLDELKYNLFNKISETEDYKSYNPDISPVIKQLQGNCSSHWKDLDISNSIETNKLLRTIDFKEEVIKYVTKQLEAIEKNE